MQTPSNINVTPNNSTEILPIKFQPPLDTKVHIINEKPSSDSVPLDVVFVGAGPAGLAGAIELVKLCKKENIQLEIGVLEKAQNVGEHCLSGAVINPIALKELFPEMDASQFPLRKAVQGDAVYYMSQTGALRLPTPPTMHNHGNYVGSICEVVRWMGDKATELGVNIITGFPAQSLLVDGNQILGVRTTATGLNRDGSPGPQFMPPTDISAKVTVLTEGTRGNLTQSYLQWQNVKSQNPQIYALGVKEIWETKEAPKNVIHTLGWPLPTTAFGGSFMYPMADNLVALGLVVGLDYKEANLDVHQLLQQMKQHPLFKKYLEGGELVEWGAKTIPEGGLYALPEKLHGNGILFAGDCVGMVNVPALKGIHYAMKAGILAARSIFDAIKANDLSKISAYDDKVKSSYIYDDLKYTRNMRLAFKKGFYSAGIKASLMQISGGTLFGGYTHSEEDAADKKDVNKKLSYPHKGVSKVDAVYLSGNKTRDDIPSHLTVGKDVSKEVAEMYQHMCPAGVYEVQGDKLVINAPNCVDCKATDILGPRWTPREGGSGPKYRRM